MDELRHLIAFEGNATALLATAFDPPSAEGASGEADRQSALRFAREFATLCGIQSVPEGLPDVHLEKDSIDLLLRWGPWAIAIEVKIRSASLTHGQLSRYHRRACELIGTAGVWKDASRIGMVFLTPDGVGADVFRELVVRGQDQRMHLGWSTILDVLDRILDEVGDDGPESPWRSLLRRGSARVRALIAEQRGRPEVSAHQLECRGFANAVRQEVVDAWTDGPLHVKLWSSAPDGIEELYARFVSKGGPGSVYFTTFADSTLGDGAGDNGLLSGRLYFWASGKSTPKNCAEFRAFQSPAFAAEIRELADSADRCEIDWQARRVTLWFRRSGSREELRAFAVRGMLAFLRVYGPLMKAGQAGEGT